MTIQGIGNNISDAIGVNKFRGLPSEGQKKIAIKTAFVAVVVGIIAGLVAGSLYGVAIAAVVGIGAFAFFTDSYSLTDYAGDWLKGWLRNK